LNLDAVKKFSLEVGLFCLSNVTHLKAIHWMNSHKIMFFFY